MSTSTSMKNAPVYYVLAQVKFNLVLQIEKFVNEIQDRFRHQKYSICRTQNIAQLQLQQGSTEPPRVQQTVSWLMSDAKEESGFILNNNSLTFHTTHYETHEKFILELLKGFNIVNEVLELDHMSRLGLRYLNAVLPKKDETLTQYLVPGVVGISLISAEQKYSLSESVYQTETAPLLTQGALIARVHQLISPLGYPPDIAPHGLKIEPRFDIKENKHHSIIDIDHFVEGVMPLDGTGMKEQLLSLHGMIKKAFDAIVTSHALQAWS